ncbi:GNAT family N-acetyltransferase [Devosia sp.]|uniref:GNAT family N-acetyltransferase n=1 Tax=Devosia sp. TaxID=1871048 RepID=UPI003BA95D1B
MFQIRPAEPADVDTAVAVLGDAFAGDPLMAYLFADAPAGVRASVMEFFSILMRVRLALGMPALVLEDGNEMLGAAMGYNSSRPAWPSPYDEEWQEFEADVPGLAARLAAYDKICEEGAPTVAHYYLGVIGIHPSAQGKGAGQALLGAFCNLSHRDTESAGVYLDTANPESLRFYTRNGFELRGQGYLDAMPLWCVFRPN